MILQPDRIKFKILNFYFKIDAVSRTRNQSSKRLLILCQYSFQSSKKLPVRFPENLEDHTHYMLLSEQNYVWIDLIPYSFCSV